MALPILAPVLRDVAINAAVRAGRGLWGQMPWAKDKARVDAVEARIRQLAADVADVARNLSDDALEAAFDRLLGRFEKDVIGYGLTAAEANGLKTIEAEQLRATVIEPAIERRQMQTWLTELESRAVRAETAAARHEEFDRRFAALERRSNMLTIALGVSLTLAAMAALLSILFFTRR